MIFYQHNIARGDVNYYVYGVLKKIINTYGHSLTPDPAAGAVHLVSLCDVTQLPDLEAIRRRWPTKKIIAGGHFAVNFKAVAIFADLVNIGQGFDIFKCKSFEEMAGLDCVYYKGKTGQLVPSTFIDWSILPVVQTDERLYYYLAAVGCKNKCAFCLTSWTNKHQTNSPTRCRRAAAAIPANCHLQLVANDSSISTGKAQAASFMAQVFLNLKGRPPARLIRIGLEFATAENRRRHGKPISDDQVVECFEKAAALGVELQFFCIGGIDTRETWFKFFDQLPADQATGPRVFFKFTNLAYEQFTPIYKERMGMDVGRYLDPAFGDQLAAKMTFHNRRVRIWRPLARPGLAIWRMGLALSTTKEQYKIWRKLKSEKDPAALYRALYNTRVIGTDYQDRLKFWYQHKQKAVENGG